MSRNKSSDHTQHAPLKWCAQPFSHAVFERLKLICTSPDEPYNSSNPPRIILMSLALMLAKMATEFVICQFTIHAFLWVNTIEDLPIISVFLFSVMRAEEEDDDMI